MDERDCYEGFDWRRGLGLLALVALLAIAILLTLALVQAIPSGYDRYEEPEELPLVTNATPKPETPPVGEGYIARHQPVEHFWPCDQMLLMASAQHGVLGCEEERYGYGGHDDD